MSHEFCRQRREVPVLPVLNADLNDACQDFIRKRQLARQPRKFGALLSYVWAMNGILALILSFLIGFCMGENQGPATSGRAVLVPEPPSTTRTAADFPSLAPSHPTPR